jgi:hypothetical protein
MASQTSLNRGEVHITSNLSLAIQDNNSIDSSNISNTFTISDNLTQTFDKQSQKVDFKYFPAIIEYLTNFIFELLLIIRAKNLEIVSLSAKNSHPTPNPDDSFSFSITDEAEYLKLKINSLEGEIISLNDIHLKEVNDLKEKYAACTIEEAELLKLKVNNLESEITSLNDTHLKEVNELKDKLAAANKNSTNSSKKGSDDITKPKPKPKKNPDKPGKPGAQKGHKANFRVPIPPEDIDEIIKIAPETTVCSCGCKMTASPEHDIVQQQYELKEKPVLTREYRGGPISVQTAEKLILELYQRMLKKLDSLVQS